MAEWHDEEEHLAIEKLRGWAQWATLEPAASEVRLALWSPTGQIHSSKALPTLLLETIDLTGKPVLAIRDLPYGNNLRRHISAADSLRNGDQDAGVIICLLRDVLSNCEWHL